MDTNGRKVNGKLENCCGIKNCPNSIKKTPNLLFVTLPPNRKGHSKWFKKTFGDTEISRNCQIVCEAHMDPVFVKILNQRHSISNENVDIPPKKKRGRPKGKIQTVKRKVGRPRKETNDKKTKSTTGKITKKRRPKKYKGRAKKKEETKAHEYDPLLEADKCEEEEPVPMKEEKETLEETVENEPPEKRSKLETTSPLQYADDDDDSITYEIIIKDDPDNFEGHVLLPSVICDDVEVEVKRERPDKTEVMDYEPEEAYQPVVDVKIETTDNLLEEQIENILSGYKIVPPSVMLEKNTQITTDLPAPKSFESFSELLDSLLKQNLINHNQSDILSHYKVDSNLFVDYTQLLNPNLKMKSFAIALYVISHKAYDYVLRTYKTTLPPLTAVKDWLVQRKGHSGFTRETLEAINFMSKDKGPKKSPLHICLVLKEITLRDIQYRTPSKRVLNVAGNSTNPLEWSSATATTVLIFTAVAINESWKLPIGYFFDNVVKGPERANLVKVAIDILETVGAIPVAISFESNDDNRRLCEELIGIHTPTVKEYFMSYSGIPIFMFPDPCYIIELIDEDLKDIECYDTSNKVVSFKDLPELLNYANIPSEKPITLKKVIASELCRKDFSSYKGPGAGTLVFLEHLQNVFDIFFPRHSGARLQKLMEAGRADKRGEDILRHVVILRESEKYIKSLKFKDSTGSLVDLDRFSSLMWLCTLIETTLMMIYKYWRQWPISIYKFTGNSTYFLANLMPQSNGTKNPNANTFQKKYKAMLEENIIKPMRCLTKIKIENFLVLKCQNPIDIINLTTAIPNGYKMKMIVHDFWKLMICETDEFTDEFVVCLSRCVTTILIYQLHCEICIGAIRNATINRTKDLKQQPENEKLNKKLVVTKLEEPSSDVIDICKKSEAVLKRAALLRKSPETKLCVPLLISKVLEEYLNRPLFEDLLHHQFDTDRTCNHLIELTRAVASCYLNLRIRKVQNTKVSW